MFMHQLIAKSISEFIGHHRGKAVYEFRLVNKHGNYVELSNYGAIVKSIVVPDALGNLANVVLGYPTFKGYFFDKCYIGATVGPFANRIANAAFTIDGQAFNLDKNDGINNNHSGTAGFNNKVFDFVADKETVTFSLHSPDGEGGFPGNLEAKVVYRWTDDNELIIEFLATTDKPTPVNFTNHSYFNLSGCAETIHNHELIIYASQMLESTPDYIPTGKIIQAGEQGFNGQKLGDVMKGSGLNNYYIFDSNGVNYQNSVVKHPASGRVMEVFTTYPGVQLYTGDYLGSDCTSGHGAPYKPFDGLCLECQFYPDSPNRPHFPDTILRPGEIYHHSIIYKFST
jgi:aldose 1-epimerase